MVCCKNKLEESRGFNDQQTGVVLDGRIKGCVSAAAAAARGGLSGSALSGVF